MRKARSRLLGLNLRLNLLNRSGLLNRLNRSRLLNRLNRSRLGGRDFRRCCRNLEARHLRDLPGKLVHNRRDCRDVRICPTLLADLVDDGNHRAFADHHYVVPASVHYRRAGEPARQKAD